MRVELDRYSLRISGVRKLIRAGSLHYFRLPSPALWRDRLEKMRQAGLNAVELCYPWNYHSETRGDYDFTDIRDVDRLHDMVEEVGLYLIARPGPYIGADIDLGGLPAWILRDPSLVPRCRLRERAAFSLGFMKAMREWFEQVVPRFATRSNLILVQVENEYTVPAPYSGVRLDLWDLLIRWFGNSTLANLARGRSHPDSLFQAGAERGWGQTCLYMRELSRALRELGCEVPIFHNDLSPTRGRQTDVDLMGLDRYPIRRLDRDWRNNRKTFAGFTGDEVSLAAHRPQDAIFYPQLQAGWHDSWGGPGYARVRALLGPESIENVSQAALAERATLWSYSVFCGGTTWGYMGSPDVYTSYDCGAPIAEAGETGARYEAVRRLNEFIDRFEEDLVETERVEPGDRGSWCPEHLVTRQGPRRRFVFLRNTTRRPKRVPTREDTRTELAPWETQIRVYGADGQLEGVSPEPLRWSPPQVGTPPPLPRLERWTFANTSPQLDPAYDDSAWSALSRAQIERGRVDMDSLGVHYGFIWYRGSFQGPLDRLLLDARHCYAVYINRELVAAGDQFQNRWGVGPDGARMRRVSLREVRLNKGRNVIVILVESLGHNQGFVDDGANPRGIVRIDDGASPIHWRFRGGLVRGERGMNPVVAFEGVERTGNQEVVLPHGWTGGPNGVGLYETRFRMEGVDLKQRSLALVFDPGRGKANLYLNGYLIGRYWPERGPQQRFVLPLGVLEADQDNHLAIAVWKRSRRAALGKVRLELI